MDDYITCLSQHNHPRLHYLICEQRCDKRAKCLSYKTWVANRVKAEVKDKSNRDEDTKKKESLIKSLIKSTVQPELKKIRKVRRAK